MNARDEKKEENTPAPAQQVEAFQPVVDIEAQYAIKTYKQVVNRIDEISGELKAISSSIENLNIEKDKQISNLESGLLNFKKQKLEALLQFESEIKQLQECIDKLNTDIADEKMNLIDNLKEYRNEIEILLLIRNIDKDANFIELNNII